ncbi:MAG: hypothetical protein AVDCRST_MAG73-681 [uncultured Thermomicrobiales bacterium]|uniref:Polymer-forming cytoskeletal protein n=1 Tax=uncultured Thermomicrobiales bacterium TaxID=1645740 RepID=A0A6J4TNA8_9BACT|nr:MAG: hypothetical protein AVDCRST_MAG73-681 [uncultured Thermomicrobiales bacterium]
MVFRKENKADAFQRQISALRQQLGGPEGEDGGEAADAGAAYDSADRVADGAGDYAAGGFEEANDYGFGGFATADQATGVTAAPPAIPTAPPMAVPEIPGAGAGDGQTSVIAHDTIWKGDLQTEGTIHVHGRVEGSIQAKQDIYVAEEADVEATLTSANVIVAGMVRGTIRCASRFEVLPAGRVAGDVQAPTFVIHDGATVTGQFRMGSGGESAAEESGGASPLARRGG